MDIHPWTKYEIARARDEERLLRALAAYEALRARREQAAEPGAGNGATGRIRLLDRLLRREAGTARAPARSAI